MKNDLTFELRFLQYALLTVDSWPECFAFLGMPFLTVCFTHSWR